MTFPFSLKNLVACLTVTAISASALSLPSVADEEVSKEAVAKAEVVAKPAPAAKPAAVAKPVETNTVRPLSVSVDLMSKTVIQGTLTDTTQLDMQTSFGVANIPLSEVAGIRFASASDASTTVVMLNGDSITGATDVKLVTVETEWGIATINGSSIGSILFVPGVDWNPQSGLNGKRWNLANEPKEPAAAKTPAKATAPRATAPAAQNGRIVYPNGTTVQASQYYRGR
ncbi:hypothetical protein Pla52o_25200 [Novipirellula galeiformis]|uniref:Uncharacterized protein n=1 Tax=Novipirellula galeiformis TaxID=2528004 RepID=A0A5C6CIG0_9BACT|nr:hypothetical protein [Novipirellula galeiformis]TWU22986.1 hypothetical protein Pla52o_25200 [Novipirellula galeiformis]